MRFFMLGKMGVRVGRLHLTWKCFPYFVHEFHETTLLSQKKQLKKRHEYGKILQIM